MNVIARLEYELAYYDSAAHRFNHYTTRTPHMEHEGDGYTSCNWCIWYSHQRIGTGTGRLGNKRTSRNHLNSIPEYWDESRRLDETRCHSNSSGKPSANAGVIVTIKLLISKLFIINNYHINVMVWWVLWHINLYRYYLPPPPLGQDMTQGQFLSGV